ncbi:MAG: acyl-CoA dehydrogenase family protein [Dehalococcoidia bacterium]
MDLDFPPECEALRQDVREYLAAEWPPEKAREVANLAPEYRGRNDEFSRKLGAKGWLGIGWPREYGGQGRSYVEQLAFHEEMGYHRAPTGKHHMAVNIVGPTLMLVGSKEQKGHYLPRILAGDLQVCMGYTEPQAGSDLASLQTQAVEDGDDYVINGQKMFTTGAEMSDICWLGARTDPDKPKHKGVSLFIVPMDTPGISISPIWCVGGLRTNHVYFENVRVPKSAMVGERGQGFYNIAIALDFERVMIGSNVGRMRRTYDDLVAYTKEHTVDGAPIIQDTMVRHKLADLNIELHIARLLTLKVMWMIDSKLIPNIEASLTKILSTEIQVRIAHVGMSILGAYGSLYEESRWAPLRGDLAWTYEVSLLGTIGGGANEIQRNIIAQRGLGLPR